MWIDLITGLIFLLVVFIATKIVMAPPRKHPDPDWKGMIRKRFRIKSLRWEYGRWCYVVHPVEGGHDITWWEWESEDKTTPNN